MKFIYFPNSDWVSTYWNEIIIFSAADQSRMMQDQMTMQAGGMQQDPKAAFKAEWEALEVTEHQWALKNSEQELVTTKTEVL